MNAQGLSLTTVALVLLCHTARADPEYARVSFQGKLANTNGAAVADGGCDMVFNFHDAASGGTLLLSDRHVAPDRAVLVSGGLYSVLLGGGDIVAGAESNLWNVFLNHPAVYLGVSVNSEPEMTPRLLLARVPYAVRAEDALTLGGKAASQFVQVTSNGNTTVSGTMSVLGNIVTSGRHFFSTPKTGRVTLGPADFVPRHPFEEQYILWGYPWKTNRHYLVCTMQSGSATFHADVHVPEGATITRVISYIWDVDSARTSVLNLARCSLNGHLGYDPVYLASIDSVDNQIRVQTTLSEVVNTTASHYVLSLRLFQSDAGMQFFGAQVEYTYNELKN